MKHRHLKPRVQVYNTPAFAVNPSSPAGQSDDRSKIKYETRVCDWARIGPFRH